MDILNSLETSTTSRPRDVVLPTPPSDDEKYIYVQRHLSVLIVSSMVSLACLTISVVHLIVIRPWLRLLVPYFAFLLVYYLMSLRVNLPSRDFDIKAHRDMVNAWTPDRHPTVDIWLPICGEDIAVLSNTWYYVKSLVDHYPGLAEVFVLDDGDDHDARDMSNSFGFNYLVRPNRGWMKKAGNLRHAYENSYGEFIVILDADFAPREDFLAETLPHMQKDPRLGIVQSPQFFRQEPGQTWMERGAGAVQELFYRVVQVSQDRFDGAICAGSCALYRRSALDSTGGATLTEHSEDMHTGFDVYRQGWKIRYLPVALATGICPPGPDSFLTQQYRWCAGTMSLIFSRKFWGTRLKFSTLLCYLTGFLYYIETAVATFAVPIIPIALLAFLPQTVRLHNFLWIAPSTIYALVIFPLWNHSRNGPASLMARSLYGWAHVFTLVDMARHRLQGWQITGAHGQRPTRRIWIAIVIWGGATSIAWVGLALYRMATMNALDFAFLLLIGLIYGWTTTVMPFVARAQASRQ